MVSGSGVGQPVAAGPANSPCMRPPANGTCVCSAAPAHSKVLAGVGNQHHPRAKPSLNALRLRLLVPPRGPSLAEAVRISVSLLHPGKFKAATINMACTDP